METIKVEQPDVLRNRDSKDGIVNQYTAGVVATATGITLAIHSYWHGLDPIMLTIAAILAAIGLYLSFKAKERGIEKFHNFTKALLPKAT